MSDDVKKLLNNLLVAIDCERQEERERHIEEIKKLTGRQREEKGRALVNLRKKKLMRTITGDTLYLFRKRDKSDLPNLEFSVGDELVISWYDPLDNANPSGIVYEVGSNYIIISTSANIEGAGVRPYRLDLFVNDLTYSRMTAALSSAKSKQSSELQTILEGSYYAFSNPSNLTDAVLNEVQKKAVSGAFTSNGFYVVQGPPGTGKTYTASILIKHLVKSGKKVLISADSNAAVDNLIKKSLEQGIRPLRIGHPIRVNDDLKQYTLDYAVVRHAKFNEVKYLEKDIEFLKEKLKEKEKPSRDKLRGYTYGEIMELIEAGKTGRGISKRTLYDMKPYAKIKVKIDKLYEEIKKVRLEIVKELVAGASVIAATNSTCASEVLLSTHFDCSIVDEASQASIPSTLIPIQKADRFILIGDHYQLPPVVISEKAKELGLDKSLMDYIAQLYPYQMTMLTKQYRMNQSIMDIVSSMFYQGKLVADQTVVSRKLDILPVNLAKEIEIINVKGRECINADSRSYYNDEEKDKLIEIVRLYLGKGIEPDDMAVITPYRAQVKKLRAELLDVEVDTVDAFQGREKDLIIISFVRSNTDGRIGFLADMRRLNVAISRAKKKVILIGDIDLLKTNEVFKTLFKRISKNGK